MSDPYRPSRPTATRFEEAADSWRQRVAENQQGAGYLPAVAQPSVVTPVVATGRPPRRRRRGLMWAGIAALVVAAGISMNAAENRTADEFGVGDISRTYSATDTLPPTIEHQAGNVKVDLSQVALPAGADTQLTVKTDAGKIDLNLPDNVNTEIDWKVGFGEANLPGEAERGGADLAGKLSNNPAPAGSPTLHITVELGTGDLTIVH